LTGSNERREAFTEEGARIIAGSVDSEEETSKVAEWLGFPIAYGMTRTQCDSIGAWREERRDHIQPSELVLSDAGRVMASTYSNSPVGRMDPEETLVLLRHLNKRARAQ